MGMEKERLGLGRERGREHRLRAVLWKTWVWFLAALMGSSQLLINSISRASDDFFWPSWALHSYGAYTYMHIYTFRQNTHLRKTLKKFKTQDPSTARSLN